MSTPSLLAERFELVGELGRGAYSIVYRANDRALGCQVAIKLLSPPPAEADSAIERVRREVRAVRALSHPGVVPIYELVEDADRAFLVMELVEGRDLAAAVGLDGPLHAEAVAELGIQVADALHTAHRSGVIHRDVKPHNILLGPGSRARLADFGCARVAGEGNLTRTGGFVGTLDYCAPEVFAGQRGDARCDVYGLGMSLYFALTGELPGRASPHTPPTPTSSGHSAGAVRAAVPAWLDMAIARATASDPSTRFPTALAFANALRARDTHAEAWRPADGAGQRFCFTCGRPHGSLVCARCGRWPRRGEQLVFALSGQASSLGELLQRWTGQGLAHVHDFARGARPLSSTDSEAVAAIRERFGRLGVQTRALPVGRLFQAFPPGLAALIACTYVAGAALAVLGHPALGLGGGVVGVVALAGATRLLATPLVRSAGTSVPALPANVEAALRHAMGSIRSEEVQRLLDDVVGIAERSLDGTDGEQRARLSELLVEASQVAVALDSADHALHRGEASLPAERLEHTVRARDVLAQRMLETLAGMIDAQLEEDASQAAHRLDVLNEELRQDLELRREALQEVEQLLSDRPR